MRGKKKEGELSSLCEVSKKEKEGPCAGNIERERKRRLSILLVEVYICQFSIPRFVRENVLLLASSDLYNEEHWNSKLKTNIQLFHVAAFQHIGIIWVDDEYLSFDF